MGQEVTDGQKYPPMLFLDELDKFSATQHTMSWLFNWLNAVMASGGAVISTTNMTPREASRGTNVPAGGRVCR